VVSREIAHSAESCAGFFPPVLFGQPAGGFITEPPRWLAKQDRWEEARATLCRVRNLPADHPYVEEEFAAISTQLEKLEPAISARSCSNWVEMAANSSSTYGWSAGRLRTRQNYGSLLNIEGPAMYLVPLAMQGLPAVLLFFGMLLCNESPRWLAKQDRWEEALFHQVPEAGASDKCAFLFQLGGNGRKLLFHVWVVIPAVLLFFGMLLCNESPRWLAKQDRWEEARATLCRIPKNRSTAGRPCIASGTRYIAGPSMLSSEP
jgi:hypothetical protein